MIEDLDLTMINALLTANVVRAHNHDLLLCYGMQQVVIARGGGKALVTGYGACGVGMVWQDENDAKNLPGFDKALRVKE